MKLNKLFFLFFLLSTALYACTQCAIFAPSTQVSMKIKADKKNIKTAEIKWTFSKEFTTELLKMYDQNLDMELDKIELQIVEESLITYIKEKDFLTFISYGSVISKESKPIKLLNYKMSLKDYIVTFEYDLDLGYEVIDKNKLYINIEDIGGYFTITFDEKYQLLYLPYKYKKIMGPSSVTFDIDAKVLANAIEVDDYQEIEVIEKKPLIEKSFEQEVLEKKSMVDDYVKKIKEYLVRIEKGGDNKALFLLLLVSFLYGVVHALGPGHGKALAFSYFSSQKSTYLTAGIISFATAFIHIVGALILVVISVLILQSLFSTFLDDSISYITQVSAILIMLLSIYILYRKLKKKSCACCACNVNENQNMFSVNAPKQANFVNNINPGKIHFETKSKKREDLYFVLTAGLIPCPGTVVLFVYAFVLETYFAVLLASIFISLGMAVVIFASSFLGVSLHKASESSQKLKDFVEISAPIVMFILGLLLLLNASSF